MDESERKKQKELMKALETPEEKRARRLAKKEAKQRKTKEKMGWDKEYLGYTNDDNPFGDDQLLNTFVWSKKLEKEGKKDLTKHELDAMSRKRMIANKIELEKVKKRRMEREREREELEQEREMLQREKEAAYYREWEKQEDTFHLKQAQLRSKIRIEDGRAKPIDLLARYISAEDDHDLSIELHEPYTYLNGLTMADLEHLMADISVYKELEQGKNAEYWRDITTIVEDELHALRRVDVGSKGFVGERRSGINQSVEDDVNKIFRGKTMAQLGLLEQQIQKKLQGGEGIDVGYWESLLQQLKAHVARTRLYERHQEQLQRKLYKLKAEQGIESAPIFPIAKNEDSDSESSRPGPSSSSSTPAGHSATASQQQAEDDDAGPSGSADRPGPSTSSASVGDSAIGSQQQAKDEDARPSGSAAASTGDAENEEQEESADQPYIDYDAGKYSPTLLQVNDLEPDTLLTDEADDRKRLLFARQQLFKTGKALHDADDELMKKAREGMNEDEARFSVEFPLEQQAVLWSDKYRPRKPRFFNRVHTGFEWNKYNQTHYDVDNPPPKIVQGYKFNIFYPDLIDKSKPPSYKLIPIDAEPDFAILRFIAGPPYEDIAFKVVNREWEFSYKRGFRCQFQNNIFQLWFHFRRYRYRK